MRTQISQTNLKNCTLYATPTVILPNDNANIECMSLAPGHRLFSIWTKCWLTSWEIRLNRTYEVGICSVSLLLAQHNKRLICVPADARCLQTFSWNRVLTQNKVVFRKEAFRKSPATEVSAVASACEMLIIKQTQTHFSRAWFDFSRLYYTCAT